MFFIPVTYRLSEGRFSSPWYFNLKGPFNRYKGRRGRRTRSRRRLYLHICTRVETFAMPAQAVKPRR